MNKSASKLTKKQSGISIVLSLLLIMLLLRPEASYAAAMRGLNLWYQVVVPALLPFFIIAELLLRLGAAEAAGRALRPLMRPLFFLPGAASLAVVLGFCSGFPTGAAVSAGLWREGLIDSAEGGRLIAFTNNAGPLYISVALATGLLGCPPAAIVLAISHYGGNLLLGMALGIAARLSISRPLRRSDRRHSTARQGWRGQHRGQRLGLAARLSMSRPLRRGDRRHSTARQGCGPGTQHPDAPAREKIAAPRAIGAILRESAETAAANILLIGCYMVFFSVLTALIVPAAWAAAHPLAAALLQGCFEMTLGLDSLAEAGLNLWQSVPLAAAILAFGGLSVQAQVIAMAANTPIRPRLYLLCRPLHAAASYIVARALCPMFALPLQVSGFPSPAQTPGWGEYSLLCLVVVGLWSLPALLQKRASR